VEHDFSGPARVSGSAGTSKIVDEAQERPAATNERQAAQKMRSPPRPLFRADW